VNILQRGDEAAFTAIYRRYWDRLFVVASHTLGSHQEAEEAVHDVFLTIWKMRETIVIRQTLQHYLAVAIKHEVIDRLRKQLRRRQLFEKFEQGSGITQGSLITEDPTGELIREKELAAELETTIRALPEKCQIVFRLSLQRPRSPGTTPIIRNLYQSIFLFFQTLEYPTFILS
jgi:RNA polymerase sigma-70 factor (ECF subfamily)